MWVGRSWYGSPPLPNACGASRGPLLPTRVSEAKLLKDNVFKVLSAMAGLQANRSGEVMLQPASEFERGKELIMKLRREVIGGNFLPNDAFLMGQDKIQVETLLWEMLQPAVRLMRGDPTSTDTESYV